MLYTMIEVKRILGIKPSIHGQTTMTVYGKGIYKVTPHAKKNKRGYLFEVELDNVNVPSSGGQDDTKKSG